MNNMRNKILMTLVALFTMTAGAWADPNILAPTITGDREFYESVEVTMICTSPNADIYYTVNGKDPRTLPDNQQIEFTGPITLTETTTIMARAFDGNDWSAMVEVTFTKQTGPKVTWDAATKTGSFEMPAYDVEIAPVYAPVAQWAKDGDNVLVPKNIEGIIAGEDKPIVTEGTVATTTYGEGSDAKTVAQGTVMYFATTEDISIEQALASDGWVSTVPTAKGFDDYKKIVYVYYYIKGMDTPQGETATDKNTFNDSKAVYTKVQLLNNKFDLTLNAANANTIEDGKATVTVGGTAATVTEGKLQGVKMGSEVKVTAKEGYKFRKVEVKKAVAEKPVTLATALEDGATLEVMCKSSKSGNGLQMGGNFTNNNGEFTRNNFVGESNVFSVMKATATISGTTITFATGFTSNDNYDHNVTLNTTDNTYTLTGGSNKGSVVSVKVNGTEVLDKLTELK